MGEVLLWGRIKNLREQSLFYRLQRSMHVLILFDEVVQSILPRFVEKNRRAKEQRKEAAEFLLQKARHHRGKGLLLAKRRSCSFESRSEL